MSENNRAINLKLRGEYVKKFHDYWISESKSEGEWQEILKIKELILKNEAISGKFYRYKNSKDWDDERLSSEISDLKNKKLTLVHPTEFNDPYDCRLSPEMLQNFLKENVKHKNISNIKKQIHELFKSEPLSKCLSIKKREAAEAKFLRDKLAETGIEHARERSEGMKKFFRIACFATTPNDMYFWSHYGGCHTGYCVEYEFNTSLKNSFFDYLHPVSYVEEMPKFELNKAKCSISLLKSMDWKQEKEWRFLAENDPDDPEYDESIKKYDLGDIKISAIYLGLDFEKKPESTEKSREYLKEAFYKILPEEKIFQMVLSDDGFGMKSEIYKGQKPQNNKETKT